MAESTWITEVILFLLVNILGVGAIIKRYWIRKATNPDVVENVVLAISCNNKYVTNCALTGVRLTTAFYLVMMAVFYILVTNGVEVTDFAIETSIFIVTYACFRLYGNVLDGTSKQEGLVIPDLITVNGETYDLSDIRGL